MFHYYVVCKYMVPSIIISAGGKDGPRPPTTYIPIQSPAENATGKKAPGVADMVPQPVVLLVVPPIVTPCDTDPVPVPVVLPKPYVAPVL